MSFRLPVFDLLVQIYTNGAGPPAAPRVVTVGNLTPGRRAHQAQLTVIAQTIGLPAMFILLPKLTDIRGQNSVGGSDLVQVPAGSGRFYTCLWADDSGKGFANEHRVAVLIQRNPFFLDTAVQPLAPMASVELLRAWAVFAQDPFDAFTPFPPTPPYPTVPVEWGVSIDPPHPMPLRPVIKPPSPPPSITIRQSMVQAGPSPGGISWPMTTLAGSTLVFGVVDQAGGGIVPPTGYTLRSTTPVGSAQLGHYWQAGAAPQSSFTVTALSPGTGIVVAGVEIVGCPLGGIPDVGSGQSGTGTAVDTGLSGLSTASPEMAIAIMASNSPLGSPTGGFGQLQQGNIAGTQWLALLSLALASLVAVDAGMTSMSSVGWGAICETYK